VAADGVTASGILEFCRHRMHGWQAPKQIFLVREIPVNERGKISRRELAEKFAVEKA
jgi:acyl-CoA synthetase (AMP-forming)/AMP-acid ligase II